MIGIGLRVIVIGILFLIIMGILALFGQAQWWLGLIIAGIIYVGSGFVLRRALFRLFKLPFRAKGAVLKDAKAYIHAVRATVVPQHDEDVYSEDETADFNYFRIDLTIIPDPATGNFKHWEPGDLRLVPLDIDIDFHDDGDAYIRIEDIKIYDGETLHPDDGYKFEGKQHLRLLVGARPDIQQAKFRYYFEEFGEVQLAATSSA